MEKQKPVCKLLETDGNAFSIMAKVTAALKKAGLHDQIQSFREEASSGDYDHLLQVCMKYVDVK